MLDNSVGICQPETIAETAQCEAVVRLSKQRETKVGRPRTVIGSPWDDQGISKATYYRRIKPALPAQISYASEPARWFCIRLPYLNDEAASEVNGKIQAQGFETFFPQEWVPPVAAHRTDAGRAIPASPERLVPLLRCYALVKFSRTSHEWRDLSQFGQILGSPEWPTPIPDRHIAQMREGLVDDVLYPKLSLEALGAKRKWVDMATALLALKVETVDG